MMAPTGSFKTSIRRVLGPHGGEIIGAVMRTLIRLYAPIECSARQMGACCGSARLGDRSDQGRFAAAAAVSRQRHAVFKVNPRPGLERKEGRGSAHWRIFEAVI